MSTAQLIAIAQWSGYFTLFCAAVAIVGWVLQWSFRFRLVGVTGFMAVMTGGLFALSLGFYSRQAIPSAVQFSRVYDGGATQVVITVPATITETQLEATLRQAALDLFSPGRLSQGSPRMTIRARVMVHPEPGLSKLLYVGQVQRSLMSRQDDQMQVEIFPDQLAQLPSTTGDRNPE